MDDNKENIRIAAVGDVMLDREVGRHFQRNSDDFSMTEIRELLGGTPTVDRALGEHAPGLIAHSSTSVCRAGAQPPHANSKDVPFSTLPVTPTLAAFPR